MAEATHRLDPEQLRERFGAFDWRRQVREHALAVGLVTGGIVLLTGTALLVKRARSRRRKRALVKGESLLQAVLRMIDEPERVARPAPSVLDKLMSTVATTAAGLLVKAIVRRWFTPAVEPMSPEPMPAE